MTLAEQRPKKQRDDDWAICPWCGHKHGDCWEWVTDMPRTTRCDECDNLFTVEADYSVTYISYVTGEETP